MFDPGINCICTWYIILFYINVARDFIVQPDVFVVTLSCICEETIATDIVTVLVFPRSGAAKSVYVVVLPLHPDITSPLLIFDALATVYLKNAEVYDPVARSNIILEPTIEDALKANLVIVLSNTRAVETTKVDALIALDDVIE